MSRRTSTYVSHAIGIAILLLFLYLIWNLWDSWRKFKESKKKKETSLLSPSLRTLTQSKVLPLTTSAYHKPMNITLGNVDQNSANAIVSQKFGPLTGNPQSDTWRLFSPDSIICLKHMSSGRFLSQIRESLDVDMNQETNIPASNYVRPFTWKVETSPFVMGALRLKNTYSGLYLGFQGGKYSMVANDGGSLTSLWATTANFISGENTDGICLFEATTAVRLHAAPKFLEKNSGGGEPLTAFSPLLLSSFSLDSQEKSLSKRMQACTWETQLITRVHHHHGKSVSVPSGIQLPVKTKEPVSEEIVPEVQGLENIPKDYQAYFRAFHPFVTS